MSKLRSSEVALYFEVRNFPVLNVYGKQISFRKDKEHQVAYLEINLTCNLKKSMIDTDSYIDCKDLAESYRMIKCLRVHDEEVVEELSGKLATAEANNYPLIVKLNFGEVAHCYTLNKVEQVNVPFKLYLSYQE